MRWWMWFMMGFWSSDILGSWARNLSEQKWVIRWAKERGMSIRFRFFPTEKKLNIEKLRLARLEASIIGAQAVASYKRIPSEIN